VTKRQRHILLTIVLAVVALIRLHAQDAQPIYRSSWWIQDRIHKLEQPIARTIIAHANDWLTRDNAAAPTARLDDPVKVTVIGEMLPTAGVVRTRLAQLVVGYIVIDGDFEEFLDTATISSIIRRDHYWRQESYVTFNETLAPAYTATPPQRSGDEPRTLSAADEKPQAIIATSHLAAWLKNGMTLWADIGFEEGGLPGFMYGKGRIGVEHGKMKLWAEVPLNVGAVDNPLLARGLSGSFGAGFAFEAGRIGGAITWNDAPEESVTTTLYRLDRSALLTVNALNGLAPFLHGTFAVRLGAGYRHLSVSSPTTDGEPSTVRGLDRIDPVIRAEFGSAPTRAGDAEKITAELYGPSLIATWSQQFTPLLGMQISASVHNLYGKRDPFLPSYSILPVLIFTLW
jgi:hypothetical protein